MNENYNMTYFSKSLPYMKFPDISLTLAPLQNFPDIFQIPWQFPDLEKINFSLTFPWRVATLHQYKDSTVATDVQELKHLAISITTALTRQGSR